MAAIASCVEACLYTAGRGQMNNVQTARQRKAEWFYRDRESFMDQLVVDIHKFVNYCEKRNIKPCVRLNGTTDIRWELIKISGWSYAFNDEDIDNDKDVEAKNIFELFPEGYSFTTIQKFLIGKRKTYSTII